jgi:hypothetical protein
MVWPPHTCCVWPCQACQKYPYMVRGIIGLRQVPKMNISLIVVHWTTGAYVSKKSISLSYWSPYAHNCALNFFISPSGYLLHLKAQVLAITWWLSWSFTNQELMFSKVAISSLLISNIHQQICLMWLCANWDCQLCLRLNEPWGIKDEYMCQSNHWQYHYIYSHLLQEWYT